MVGFREHGNEQPLSAKEGEGPGIAKRISAFQERLRYMQLFNHYLTVSYQLPGTIKL